MKAILA